MAGTWSETKKMYHGEFFLKGWLAIAKLKPLSLFISIILMLKKAIDNREIKSESGFSFAMASQPFKFLTDPFTLG